MKNNLEYWQSIYSDMQVPVFPSQFAVFVHSWLRGEKKTIVEFGCGNGRDSLFFHNAGYDVIVTDQCIGEELKGMAAQSPTLDYMEGDVVEVLDKLELSKRNLDDVVIYSRFFQHAIPETKQQEMLSGLGKVLSGNSKLFFEFRLQEDQNTEKVFGSDHFRRFQSDDEFIEVLKASGLDCEYHCKGQGYARYGIEDPVVGRFVASPRKIPMLRAV